MTSTRDDTEHRFFGETDDGEEARLSQIDLRVEVLTSAMVDAADLDRLPDPEPLIDGTLFRDTICWLYGSPGHGKSFVALDLAYHVALGRTWYDRNVHQGVVLYIVAEGARGMKARRRAWEVGNYEHIPRRVVHFLPVAVQLLKDIDQAAVLRVIERYQPVLIVIDTQARVTVGADENSSKDMGWFVEAADRLRQVCGSCVLAVHHQGRSGDHMRGSNAPDGGADTTMRVSKDGPVVDLTCTKMKDAEEFTPLHGSLVPVAGSAYWSHEVVGLARSVLDSERAIYAAMRDQFETTGASHTTLRDATDLAKATFNRGLKSLVLRGILRNDGTRTRTLYVLTDLELELPLT